MLMLTGITRSFKRHELFFIAVVILLFAVFARQGHAEANISPEDREKLFQIANEEYMHLATFLGSIDKDELPQGDYEFYDFWLKGLEKERAEKPADAIAFYEKALAADVFEISTYDVLFSLGRAYFLIGEKDRALSALQEFIKNAEHDLAEPGPNAFTPEGEQNMRKSIKQARWLITLCN